MYNKSGNSFDAVGPVLRKRAVYKPDVQFQNTQRNQYTEGQYKKIIYDNSQIGINDTKHIQYRPRHNTGIQENVFTRPSPVENARGAYDIKSKTIEVRPTFKPGTERIERYGPVDFYKNTPGAYNITDKILEARPTFKPGTKRIEYYGPNSDFSKDNLVKQNFITPIKGVDAEYTAPGVFATHDRTGFSMFSNNRVTDPATGLPLTRGVSVNGGVGYTTNSLIGEDSSYKDKFSPQNPYTENLEMFNRNIGRRSTPRGYAFY